MLVLPGHTTPQQEAGLGNGRARGRKALPVSPAVRLAQPPLQQQPCAMLFGDSMLSWPLPGFFWSIHSTGQGGYQHILKLTLQQPLMDCS